MSITSTATDGGSDFKPDDLEDIFGRGEAPGREESDDASSRAASGTGASNGDSGDSADKGPPPVSRDEFEKLQSKLQEQEKTNAELQARLFSEVSSLTKTLSKPREDRPVPPDDLAEIDRALNYAAQNDEGKKVLGQLIARRVDLATKKAVAQARDEALRSVDSRNASERLADRIVGLYGEDLKRGSSSEILKNAPNELKVLRGVLAQHMNDTSLDKFMSSPDAERLAYSMSAAMNPNAVAKQEVERYRREKAAREEQAGRLSGMSSGGTGIRRQERATITDADEDIARSMGIDLDNPEVRKRILANKESETLSGIRALGVE